MKNLGIYLLMYNLLCLSVIYTDWYAKVYPYLDATDTIPYVIASVVFFTYFKKLTILQRDCFIAGLFTVVLKWVYCFNPFNFETYIFWNLIIIATPFILKVERNLVRK